MIEVVDSGIVSATASMDIDREWLDALSCLKNPKVRFYEWKQKACTFGYFIDPEKYLDTSKAAASGFELARRPTGGGMLFHYDDFSYTVACRANHPQYSQNVLSNYHLIHSALRQALSKVGVSPTLHEESTPSGKFSHFCMATATKYDLIYQGKKLGGCAQRKTQSGFIHQGTLFLLPPDWEEIASLLYPPKEALRAMQANMATLFPRTASWQEMGEIRFRLKEAFCQALDQL